ncbi:hypothetical protein DFR47_103294 [Pseudochrobactrum asaccharolyticum]|uniref:Uncharacterized protein n=1 Tax=Pseudochrobactrum asaccharolyticum TaxID=354351 RepID=A0A366E038_9HYPH|nr:hypothetical protein DFR47_103294 [Pseudochrobactrum asaccharolyticum]
MINNKLTYFVVMCGEYLSVFKKISYYNHTFLDL